MRDADTVGSHTERRNLGSFRAPRVGDVRARGRIRRMLSRGYPVDFARAQPAPLHVDVGGHHGRRNAETATCAARPTGVGSCFALRNVGGVCG
jgi:hypothetical protein